jgi:hypothetical protein
VLGFEDSSPGAGVSDFPHRYQDSLKQLQEPHAEADHRRLAGDEQFLKLRHRGDFNSKESLLPEEELRARAPADRLHPHKEQTPADRGRTEQTGPAQ